VSLLRNRQLRLLSNELEIRDQLFLMQFFIHPESVLLLASTASSASARNRSSIRATSSIAVKLWLPNRGF
jgi:hypothetical protein